MVTEDKESPPAVTKGSSALPKVRNCVSTVPTPLAMGDLFACCGEGLIDVLGKVGRIFEAD